MHEPQDAAVGGGGLACPPTIDAPYLRSPWAQPFSMVPQAKDKVRVILMWH